MLQVSLRRESLSLRRAPFA